MAAPVTTAEEMGRIDARAIENYGIPSACLMESAGARASGEIWRRFGRSGLRVLVVAGKGNNGGDGFVVARHLLNRGAEVRLAVLFSPDEAVGDPALFLSALQKMGVKPAVVREPADLDALGTAAAGSDLLVDAILGTGFKPPARGLIAEALSVLAERKIPVAALDIPSGLDATSGAAGTPHLRAALTLTFGALKRGHLLMPSAEHVGEVVVLDIGIPGACFEEEDVPLRLTEPADVAHALPRRRPDAHKGDSGHLLLVAGSTGMMGAALMAALSALKIGAGRVTLAVPETLAYVVENGPPEVMALPLPATSAGTVDPAAFDLILERALQMSALVVGPGLSTHPRTVELVHRLIQHFEGPMLLDADGLNALAQDSTVLSGARAQLALTPHPGEMARLAGISSQEVQADRVNLSIEFAVRHRLHLALKGAGTIIASPDGTAWINPTGGPALATAGTGDILSGTVGGLLAQSTPPEAALVAGTYLHGRAGDLFTEEVGAVGLAATDLLPNLPRARKRVLEEAGEGER